MTTPSSSESTWWIAVIAWRGIICHVRICTSHDAAAESIAAYLREHHRYAGPTALPAIAEWVSDHEPDFDVQIVEREESPMAKDGDGSIDDAVGAGQFIVISLESKTDHPREYSAWLYEGALDFDKAFPVRFGLGSTITSSLAALADELRADSV